MNDRMTEADTSSPTADPVAGPLTIEAAVNKFCLRQNELMEWLGQMGGRDGAPLEGPPTDGGAHQTAP